MDTGIPSDQPENGTATVCCTKVTGSRESILWSTPGMTSVPALARTGILPACIALRPPHQFIRRHPHQGVTDVERVLPKEENPGARRRVSSSLKRLTGPKFESNLDSGSISRQPSIMGSADEINQPPGLSNRAASPNTLSYLSLVDN